MGCYESCDLTTYEGVDADIADGVYFIKAVAHTSRGPYLSHDQRHTVDLWSAGGDNQKWCIKRVSGETGVYTISAVVHTERGPYLSHDRSRTVDLWTIAGINQHWKVKILPNVGAYIIKAGALTSSGLYVSHNTYKVVDLWPRPGINQHWKIQPTIVTATIQVLKSLSVCASSVFDDLFCATRTKLGGHILTYAPEKGITGEAARPLELPESSSHLRGRSPFRNFRKCPAKEQPSCSRLSDRRSSFPTE